MRSSRRTLTLGAAASRARAVCIFVHGRGQSPDEMRSHVFDRLVAPDVAFVLPRAPRAAWWDARAVAPLTPATRAQLSEAIDVLSGVVAQVRSEMAGRPLLLAGFSQGACLCVEYVLAGLPRPEALAALTGCRVGVADDVRPEASLSGLPVYLTGGDADPWIPVSAYDEAARALRRCDARLRTALFPGRPHEVCGTEIDVMGSMLDDLVAGGPIGL